MRILQVQVGSAGGELYLSWPQSLTEVFGRYPEHAIQRLTWSFMVAQSLTQVLYSSQHGGVKSLRDLFFKEFPSIYVYDII